MSPKVRLNVSHVLLLQYAYIHTVLSISLMIQAGRPEILFFWPAFATRLLTPGHENPAMGFLWGADQDYRWWAQKNVFLMLFILKKP